MICFGGFEPRSAIVAALAMSIALATTVSAQERPIHLAQAGKTDKTEKLETLQQRDQDLKAARDAQGKSIETEAALKREIEQIGADRRKLNQALIDTAGRIRKVETQDRGDRNAAQAARRERAENPQVARRPPRGNRRSAGRAAAHRPSPAAGA